MIVLDTNVISEPTKPQADPAVQAWLDRQTAETLYLTATSLSELLLGIEILPAGARKRRLAAAMDELLAVLFGGRVLAFDGTQLSRSEATFCFEPGKNGKGSSFQSVNYPTKYIRHYYGKVYIASNGGTNPWDASAHWTDDASFIVSQPWSP